MLETATALNELTIERLNFPNPLKIERAWLQREIRAVSALIVDKLPAESTIGIHGTSLHAIRKMIEKGRLMPGAVRGDFTEGAIYFEPRADAMEKSRAKMSAVTMNEMRGLEEEYTGYAAGITRINSIKHALLAFLNLDFGDKENHDLLIDLSEIAHPEEVDKAISKLSKKGVADDRLAIAMNMASRFCGVLIGINDRALRDFKLGKNKETLEAPRFIAPFGMDDSYFTGIVALGPVEKEFFRRLSRI